MTDEERFKNYIQMVHWKYAKTYANTFPHEYTVREWRKDLEEEFEWVVAYIRRVGKPEPFFTKIHIYLGLAE